MAELAIQIATYLQVILILFLGMKILVPSLLTDAALDMNMQVCVVIYIIVMNNKYGQQL